MVAFVGLLTGWFHVDDVVLLQVVARRGEDILGTDVVEEDAALVPVFTDHTDAVQTGCRAQVAGHSDGFEQGDAVAGDFVRAYPVYFTQNGELEVQEVYHDSRVLDVFSVDEALLDEFGQLAAGQTFYMELTQDREVDVTVDIYQVTAWVLAVGRGIATGAGDATIYIDGEVTVTTRDVKRQSQFRVLAVDDDTEFVVAVNHSFVFLNYWIFLQFVHVLQIDEVLASGTGT